MESQRSARARSPSAAGRGTPPTTERRVQKTIVALLRQMHFKVYVFSDRRRVVTPGIPDIYALHPGKGLWLWIEVKAPGGQLRPEQAEFAAFCRQARIPHLVVDKVDTLWQWLSAHGLFVET